MDKLVDHREHPDGDDDRRHREQREQLAPGGGHKAPVHQQFAIERPQEPKQAATGAHTEHTRCHNRRNDIATDAGDCINGENTPPAPEALHVRPGPKLKQEIAQKMHKARV
eukprot:TRINITY_DN4372_c0_g1_i8.p2 TRINITY_DN4372_c0_g1~~TRINITY_DN4372_c0_g1_i8.p2  ORF type:complete len:111 (-),score=5.05 TRINITY_DN4372_c0_g1_i8:563-895(-)